MFAHPWIMLGAADTAGGIDAVAAAPPVARHCRRGEPVFPAPAGGSAGIPEARFGVLRAPTARDVAFASAADITSLAGDGTPASRLAQRALDAQQAAVERRLPQPPLVVGRLVAEPKAQVAQVPVVQRREEFLDRASSSPEISLRAASSRASASRRFISPIASPRCAAAWWSVA
jgi:hypothetical protein